MKKNFFHSAPAHGVQESLVPWPGMEPDPQQWKQSPNHWELPSPNQGTTRELLSFPFKMAVRGQATFYFALLALDSNIEANLLKLLGPLGFGLCYVWPMVVVQR